MTWRLSPPQECATESCCHQCRSCSVLAAGECEYICSHTEAKTFGQLCGKKGNTSLKEKHQGQTEILQKVQELDCRKQVQSYYLMNPISDYFRHLENQLSTEVKECYHGLCHANSLVSWYNPCVGLLLIEGRGLTHNSAQERCHE